MIYLLLFLILNYGIAYSSVTNVTYANDCLGCLMNNYHFCATADTSIYATGVCCMNMKTDTDYCNGANPYCTYSLPSGGARFNKCVRSTACGNTNTFFLVKNTIEDTDIKIKAKGVCDYTIYFTMMDPSTDFTRVD